MKTLKTLAIPLAVLLACSNGIAYAQDDVIFKALKDEMDRSMSSLKIKGHDAPYFIAYSVKEKEIVRIAASFGAITSKNLDRDRDLNVELRVGNYDLDNTRFSDGGILGALLGGRMSRG